MFPLPSLRQISVNQQLLRFYLVALLLNVGFVLPAAQGSPPLLELSPQPDKLVLSWVPQPQSANFLQVSDNLVDWNYHSLTLPGSSPMRSLDFPATPGPRFFRAVSHVYAGNDPDAEDFDGDGLTTRDEILTFGTDPLVRDSNGDGVADGDGDSDMDGLPDSVEIRAGLDAHDSADSSGDLDRDGITNLTEYQTGTDPANPDTDHDGLGDAWESLHGAPLIFSDSAADEDLDGLTSLTECLLGTSPHLADTDTNGITDASEDFDLDGVSNLQEQIAGTSSLNYYDNMSVSVTLVSGNYQAISPGETTVPVIVKVAHAGASGAALANAPIFVAPTCAGTVGGISQPSTVYRTGQDGTFSFTFAAAAEALIGTSPLFIGLGSLPTGQSLARVNLEIISPISPEGAISAATYSGTLKQVGMTSSTTELAAGRAVFPVVVKLADLPMPADTVPWRINDRGQVAYLDYNLNGLLVWNGRSLVTIPQEHPGFLYVRDLNSAGKLVGELQRVVLEGFSFSRTTWAFHADIGAARLSILKPYVPDLYEFFEDQNFGTWMPFSRFNALNRSSLSHIAESGTAWGVQDGFQNIATASPFPSRKNCVTEKLDGIPASYQTYSGNWKRLPGNSSAFHKVRNGTLAIGPVGAIRVPFIISPDASHSLLSVGSSFVKIEETTGSSSYSTRSITRLEAHPDIRLPAQLPGAVVGITDVGDIAGSTNSGTCDPYFLRNGTLVRFPAADQVLGLANRKLSEPAMVFGKKGVWLQRTDPVTGLPQLLTKGANSFEYRTYQEFCASLALSNLSALAVSKQGNTVVLAGTNVQGLIKNVTVSLIPVDLVAYKRGTIQTPGFAIPRPSGTEVYEVVTLENADYDETTWQPTTMADGADENKQDGKTDAVNTALDDDFVKLRFSCPIPAIAGSSEIIFDQAGQGERLQTDDIRFYTSDGQRVLLANLNIIDLSNPTGPLAAAFGAGGLDLFAEIVDLGKTTSAQGSAESTTRKYADLIWKITLAGTTTEQKVRIYRGGFWRNDRTNNVGTIALYDGKGRKPNETTDFGQIVKGPFNMKTGQDGFHDETTPNKGPTPLGWYGLWDRNPADVNGGMRTTWDGTARPQTNHHNDASGTFLSYVQQGSYCQWASAGNYDIPNKGLYGYDNNDKNAPYVGMPDSIHFKFELSPIGDFTTRTFLQIHPDGFCDGTAGCVGIQSYADCTKVLFLVRHYFQTNLLVD